MSYRVYFGRLPETLLQEDFEKLLEEHGKAKNIEWKSGYAYVDYRHGSDASNTVQNLNGKEIGGNNILVELAQNGVGGYSIAGGFSARMKTPLPRPVRTPHRVRIENLSSRAKWMELKELLSLAGEVTFADTHKRKHGEGIVEFASRRDLTHAIKMFDKTLFFGKTIRIYDESPENRSRGRDEPRARDESRSHSRSPRRRSSPGSRSKKNKRSRSRSGSPNRKKSPSKRGLESRKNSSRSVSPQRRSRKHKHTKSRSASPSPHKYHHHSRLPTKSSRHSPKKAKKSKRDESRSNSRSPRRKRKHKEEQRSEKRKHKRSHSSSSSDNDVVSKKKTKNSKKKKHSSNSESKSDSNSSSSSKEDSESDNHTK